MVSIYKCYACKKCNKETILISEEVEDTIKRNKYISCSHCGSRDIKEQKSTNNLKECMDHAAYKRKNGAIRQVHSG